MKKALLMLSLIPLCFGVLSGCGGHTDLPAAPTDASAVSPAAADSPAPDGGETEPVTIAPQVVYDENGIRITLTGFGSDLDPAAEDEIVFYGAWLTFTIENGTDMDLSVGCPCAMMNGIMLEPMFQCYPSAGQTLEGETANFSYREMLGAGLGTISSVSFVLVVGDTAQTFSDVKYVQLTTSASDYVQPVYTPAGAPILDANGFRAYYLGSETDGDCLLYSLYVKNDTENMASVSLEDPLADGTSAEGHTFLFNSNLLPDSAAFVRIQVQTGDADYAGPASVEALTGALVISGYGDAGTVYASGQVSLPWGDAAQEPAPYQPMDIFGGEFNPFGMEFPDPFTVFSASFNKGSSKLSQNQFVLSMTGSGNMYACVAYWLDAAGLNLDDGEKMERLEEYRANGFFLEFTGADGQLVTIRQADPNDDRYEYVESDGSHDFVGGGCVVELTFFVPDADVEAYTELVRDNYDLEALTALSDYMDVEPDFSECGFGVNLHKQQAVSYVVYYPSDAAAVEQSMELGLPDGWWEWNGMKQTSILYGAVDSKLTFDTKANAITIEQTNPDFPSSPSGTAESEESLTKLGFAFDAAGACGVLEIREPHYISVAIHRPEWGAFDGDWNIEYIDTDVQGYSLRITYYAQEDKYRVSVGRDGQDCSYEYYPATDEKGGESPDIETVQRMFNDAFGTREKELYYKPLADFEQLVQERFGHSVAELYALPVS